MNYELATETLQEDTEHFDNMTNTDAKLRQSVF